MLKERKTSYRSSQNLRFGNLKIFLEENVWPQINDVYKINLYAAKIENRKSVLKKFGETHFHW